MAAIPVLDLGPLPMAALQVGVSDHYTVMVVEVEEDGRELEAIVIQEGQLELAEQCMVVALGTPVRELLRQLMGVVEAGAISTLVEPHQRSEVEVVEEEVLGLAEAAGSSFSTRWEAEARLVPAERVQPLEVTGPMEIWRTVAQAGAEAERRQLRV